MKTKNSSRIYKKNECIAFRSTKAHYGALSNMSAGFPIQIKDMSIRNSEVLYQSLRFPHNPEIQAHILNIASPIIAKNLAKKHLHLTRPDWMQVRFQIMLFCIELKLIHNWETFSTILLATKDLPIVEESKKDKVWGAIDKGEYYEGVNALGRLLMYVREKIRTNQGVYNVEIPVTGHLSLLGIDLKEIPTTLILAQIP